MLFLGGGGVTVMSISCLVIETVPLNDDICMGQHMVIKSARARFPEKQVYETLSLEANWWVGTGRASPFPFYL